jgi:transcriptional regulator with XRE-family HTH domain
MRKLANKWKKTNIPEICKKLRKYRLQKEMTQAELEYYSGVGQNLISMYECGKLVPRIHTVRKLFKALEVSDKEPYGKIKNLSEIRKVVKERFKRLENANKVITNNFNRSKDDISELYKQIRYFNRLGLFTMNELAKEVGILSPYILNYSRRINKFKVETVLKAPLLFEEIYKFINRRLREIEK